MKKYSPPYLKDGIVDFVEMGKYYGDILNYDEDLMLDKIKEIADKEQAKVIIFEGVVALSFDKINNFAEIKVFINVDDDIKLIRRIQRSNYYKRLVGEKVEEAKRDFGDSIKETFDLWMWRKKVRSSDPDYNRDVMSKRRHADLILDNNYPEDLEKNFAKIIVLINLYFKSEEEFKSKLEVEKHEELKNLPKLVEKLQEKKRIWEKEKNDLNQQINQLQLRVIQQGNLQLEEKRTELETRIEIIPHKERKH